jgi:hypothetical protein
LLHGCLLPAIRAWWLAGGMRTSTCNVCCTAAEHCVPFICCSPEVALITMERAAPCLASNHAGRNARCAQVLHSCSAWQHAAFAEYLCTWPCTSAASAYSCRTCGSQQPRGHQHSISSTSAGLSVTSQLSFSGALASLLPQAAQQCECSASCQLLICGATAVQLLIGCTSASQLPTSVPHEARQHATCSSLC